MTKGHDAEAAVVLVNGAGGAEMPFIRDALIGSFGTPTILLEQEELGSRSLVADLRTGTLEVDGRRVRPVVVWARHCSAAAIAAQSPVACALLDAVSRAGLVTHLAGSAFAALPGAAPAGADQLTDARRLGVRVPDTLVTTDPATGVRQLGAARAVIKTQDFRLYEADRLRWSECLPEITGPGTVPRPVPGRPVIVQEYVVHDRELRVYYLNGGVCAFEIGKPGPSSMWTDTDSVTVTPVDCPAGARTAVRTLCAAWRLRFGAFDLLVLATGELVFLEVNPDGDWLWFERKARWHGVSFMAAVMVRELFIQGTALGARADDCDAW